VDRAKGLEFARSLESDLLSRQAEDQRKWLVLWLTDVSNINVNACSGLLGPVVGFKKNYDSELFTQMLGFAAAVLIANLDKTTDDLVVYTAGLDNPLKT
jgi:hypothetical protein